MISNQSSPPTLLGFLVHTRSLQITQVVVVNGEANFPKYNLSSV